MKFIVNINALLILALSSSVVQSEHGVYGGDAPPADRRYTSMSNKNHRLATATASLPISSTVAVIAPPKNEGESVRDCNAL